MKISVAFALGLSLALAAIPTLGLASLEMGQAAYRQKDHTAAFQELFPVAQAGNAQAQRLIGAMFLDGTGVTRSETDALKWFRLAADQGDTAAMHALGRLYVQGQGVEQDFREASRWFRRADAGLSNANAVDEPEKIWGTRIDPPAEHFSACQQVAPSMPKLAIDKEIDGAVVARAFIDRGVVKDVLIMSGPTVFHDAVRQAMLQYDCSQRKLDVLATQEFVFSIDDGPRTKPIYTVAQLEPTFRSSPPHFNSTWHGLSSEQKKIVKRQYLNLQTDDEPPYPTEGMGALIELIRIVAEQLGVQGVLRLDARVGASGAVEEVKVLESPDPELSKYAAAVVYRASYKAAQCQGQPCAISLPVAVAIARRSGDRKTSGSRDDLQTAREAAQRGDPQAQNDLGEQYEHGRGVTKDMVQALTWYQLSAGQGFASGQNNLARAYDAGRGIEKDLVKAADLYRLAAAQGYAPAQSNFGYMLMNGRGVPLDAAEGVKWFQRSADQGYALGQNNLGYAYALGRGVQQDWAQAMYWYYEAAKRGNARAQLNMAMAYQTGQGVDQDLATAVKWLRKAAQQGNSVGQMGLGLALMRGSGATKNMTEAVKWYQSAANQGFAPAQNNLADAYENGYGVEVDLTQALKWYTLAAEQKYATAIYSLSQMHADGRGVAKDPDKALHMLNDAAELGQPGAQYALAQRYADGNGVTKDASAAAQWYRKAAKSGMPAARDKLRELGLEN